MVYDYDIKFLAANDDLISTTEIIYYVCQRHVVMS